MRGIIFFLVFFSCHQILGQNVQLFRQFNGRVDFTMIGNTLNRAENGTFFSTCEINTSASASLQLQPNDEIEAAYLYWAGSGNGDFNVKLNNISITPSRTFSDNLQSINLSFFSAFADVTTQIRNTRNGNYTLSDLDLRAILPDFCRYGVNFAGWSILIIYKNNNLPLNQINVYDGLQHVPSSLTIQLNNLNVIDTQGAEIAFLAWEGDAGLNVDESLFINGNLIGNPPLNPSTNAFNGTNSFTNSSNLYNMDMDVYSIENYISSGDTSATVALTSGRDFVMINTVVTKLNSQLPDATVVINNSTIPNCEENKIVVDFTVYNENSTGSLVANTSISIYAANTLLTRVFTVNEIVINENEQQIVTLTIPDTVLPDFGLLIIIDEENAVREANESNNSALENISFPEVPQTIQIKNLEACNIGFEKGIFDLTSVDNFLQQNYSSRIRFSYFSSENDLLNSQNAINISLPYTSNGNPQNIYVKTENPIVNLSTICYAVNTFQLELTNCPPNLINGFSPNGDGINDEFEIKGLRNIFTEYSILVYNRYGSVVFKGNNNKPNWNGRFLNQNKDVPAGIYYYVVFFNDNTNKPINGWIYVNR